MELTVDGSTFDASPNTDIVAFKATVRSYVNIFKRQYIRKSMRIT